MLKQALDPDGLHFKRVDTLVRQARETGVFDYNNFFISERVAETIGDEKILLTSFDKEKILSFLPYTNNLYVCICPACAKSKDIISDIKVFTARQEIVPILTARYSVYDEALKDFILKHDHVPKYEYDAFRYLMSLGTRGNPLCHHCINEARNEAISGIETDLKEKAGLYYDQILSNIYPHTEQDTAFLDVLNAAFKQKDSKKVKQLMDTSYAVYSARSASALFSPITIDDSSFSILPDNVLSEIDEALNVSTALKRQISEGFGLKIPIGMPLEQHIEMIQDYRPRISRAIDKTTKKIGKNTDISRLQKEIIKLNGEIERISASRRYAVIESAVDLFSNNRALLTTAIISGALGYGGSMFGCAPEGVGAGATASALSLGARRMGLTKPSEKLEKLIRRFTGDLQPAIDQMLVTCLGVSSISVNVLSIRRDIARDERSAIVPSRALPKAAKKGSAKKRQSSKKIS